MPMRVSPCLCLFAALLPASLRAQPKPGDIFREYHYTSEMIVEFDAGSKQQNPKALLRRSISHRERNLDIWDLEDAERAEVALEFWGGHPGTSDQKLRVNGGEFIQIPQIEGTPTDPRCYHRMLPGTAVVPIPLLLLQQGRNVFEFRAGPQICHSIDWGIYKIYSFTVRVYYNSSKPHATGRIVSPRPAAPLTICRLSRPWPRSRRRLRTKSSSPPARCAKSILSLSTTTSTGKATACSGNGIFRPIRANYGIMSEAPHTNPTARLGTTADSGSRRASEDRRAHHERSRRDVYDAGRRGSAGAAGSVSEDVQSQRNPRGVWRSHR